MKPCTLLALFVASLFSSCSTTGNDRSRVSVDRLLIADTVVTMDESRLVLSPGAVAVQGTQIVAVGNPDDLTARYQAAETKTYSDSILMPGLVNTHTHIPMVLFRGFTDGLSLEEWLTTRIFPAEAAGVTPESVRAGTRLGLAEMIRSGTTTYCDMYYFEDVIAEETSRAGVRGVLGWTVIGFPVPDAADPDAALARIEPFLQRFQDDPLITPAVAPHSTYTLDPEPLERCRELADRYGAPVVIHLSETAAEVGTIRERYDKSPVEHAEAVGLLGGPTVAAHMVHPTPSDIEILARCQVGIAHCPESNMKLGSGVAPITELRAAGLSVGLGTDGAASNDDLNLFEEIDTAAKLQKVHRGDPAAIDARTVVEMATLGGAHALGLGTVTGSLEAGKEADLIVLDASRAGAIPRGDVWSHLAYVAKASDVRLVMVAGQVLLQDGALQTLDEAAAIRDVQAWRQKIDEALQN